MVRMGTIEYLYPTGIADGAFASAGAAEKIDDRGLRRSGAKLSDLPHGEQPIAALDAPRVQRGGRLD